MLEMGMERRLHSLVVEVGLLLVGMVCLKHCWALSIKARRLAKSASHLCAISQIDPARVTKSRPLGGIGLSHNNHIRICFKLLSFTPPSMILDVGG